MKTFSPINTVIIIVIATLTAIVAWWIHGPADKQTIKRVGHPEHADQAEYSADRGPHGGRLLHDGAFAVEITLYERGVPPE